MMLEPKRILATTVVLLAVAAGAIAMGGVPVATLLAGAAAGTMGAAWLLGRGLEDKVATLRVGTAALAEGSSDAVVDGRSLGPLAPLADDIGRAAEAMRSAYDAATTDRLTHVANRQTLLAQLFTEADRASRHGRPLSLLFIDIDHFKATNDTYGHAAGDEVLQAVARVFRENVRDSDTVGRYGGEEFVVVLPETTVDEAAAAAEKLRLLVLKERIRFEDEQIAVSISIGVAGGSGGRSVRVDDLLRDADNAMYSAKSLGRNQSYIFAEVDDDTARIPRAPITPEGRARASEVGDLGRRAAEAALASAVNPLPHYRGKPSSLIASIAVQLAERLELPEQEVERIRLASLLHDIGKVGIPDDILEKPGPLTPEEWQSVLQHPQIGQAIINHVAAIRDAGAIILHHHERYSGHGYPHGLRQGEIPLGARIVAIADAYDAMIHDRPYRKAVTHDEAVAELRRHAGMQFDPELVEIFCDLFAESEPQADGALLPPPITPIGMQPRRRQNAARARRNGKAAG